MGRTTEAVTARVPGPMKRRVEELAEETGNSQSAMARELIKTGLEERDRDESPPGRSVSALTILGVVAIAVAPTLLATGFTAIGAVFGAIGALYALLWATAYDGVVEDALGTARDELREVGGVVGFFRFAYRKMRNDHHVEDPDTVIERAARLDILAEGALVGLLAVLIPLGLAAYVGVLEPFLAAVGTTGVRAIVLLIVALAYGFAFLMAVSALASLAIATAGGASTAAEEVADG